MNNILNKIRRGPVPRAQKIVIYAPEGFGKSTLASKFPDPLFLDVEESTAQLDVTRLCREDLPDVKAVEKAVTAIVEAQACKTLVVDTADWLEQMVCEAMIRDAGSDKIQGIEDFGYGKGYTLLREKFTLLLARFDMVIQTGMNVVFLAHAQVKKHEPPDGAGPYDRYELKLSKQVAPLLKEWADMLLFGNWRVQVKEKDRNEAGAQFKAVGGRERLLHCNRCAAWDAKNRHGLGDVEKWDISTIEKAFRAVGAPWGETISTPAGNGARGEPSTPVSAEPVHATPVSASKPPRASDDPIPGIERAESPDPELTALLAKDAESVNAYLRDKRKIGVDQTYLSLEGEYRARILKNPAGFLNIVRAHCGARKEAA